MNLLIDQGNSSVKIALFEQNVPVRIFHAEEATEAFLFDIVRKYQPQAGILCSVRKLENMNKVKECFQFFVKLNNQLPLPITIDYHTPRMLGMDRIAAASGAVAQKPYTNLLIIDIGTAITIDFVTDAGVYKGGNISPGLDMRFKALHRFTDQLPLIGKEGDLPTLGYNTETAIRAGVIEGIARELDSYISEYKQQGILVFLTGGQAFFFERKLKNVVVLDENLVFKGLNEILNYNYQQI